MVWFQCEDCGDNLKKPKLPNHFRQCSAFKLSCIDCGQVFGQHDVEGHTQCITEAEKYGPKGQGKATNGSNAKPKNDAKPKLEVDINVGLSERAPWFCSLCNTKATSKQALLLHADGKKHRAKARGFHAKQQASYTVQTNPSAENNANQVAEIKDIGDLKVLNSSKVAPLHDGPGVENNSLESSKKRKLEASENGDAHHKSAIDASSQVSNGKVIEITGAETEVTKVSKKAKLGAKDDHSKLYLTEKTIKWKKLIASALKSNPDGALKLKKLKKIVVKSLKDSGCVVDRNQVSETIEQKVGSSSRFVVDGKYVRLAASS